MFDYIKGTIAELTPAKAVIECGGIGFDIQISLQTFQALQNKENAKVYLYHYLREDDEQFYGFATKDERELFILLIGVSGIGVGTARMMLSSLTDEEIRQAILAEDVVRIDDLESRERSVASALEAVCQTGSFEKNADKRISSGASSGASKGAKSHNPFRDTRREDSSFGRNGSSPAAKGTVCTWP